MTTAHTVGEFEPCRDATEEMQVCSVCGEDQRDHLGYAGDSTCGKRVRVRGWYETCSRGLGHEGACGPWGALQ